MSEARVNDRERALVERDAYDEAAFERALEASSSLMELVSSGARLMPRFEGLVHDVFSALFKYAVVRREGRKSDALAHRILNWVMAAPGYERLNAEATLDETRAAFAAQRVSQTLLEALRGGELFSQDELLEAFEATRLEDELRDAEALRDALSEAAERDEQPPPEASGEQGGEVPASPMAPGEIGRSRSTAGSSPGDGGALRPALEAEIDALQRALAALVKAQEQRLGRMSARLQSQVRDLVDELPQQMREAEAATENFAAAMGSAGDSVETRVKLELGERLARSDKLQRLARLVGAFRQMAVGLRQRRFERRGGEVHSIERGRDLARIVPSELVTLRHPILRRDFLRRYLEGTLLQASIRSNERAGKGPMVICLDGSSSMQGPKEMWAKAVALTLVELGRRDRRPVRALVFSAVPDETRAFSLLERGPRPQIRAPEAPLDQVVAFAEYFPRGGTRFEDPLERAVELLRQDEAMRRGDIVLITDGEAHVSKQWIAWFEEQRRALEFSLHAVVVDVGSHRGETIEKLADRVTSVRELTVDAVGDLLEAI